MERRGWEGSSYRQLICILYACPSQADQAGIGSSCFARGSQVGRGRVFLEVELD